MKDVPYIQSIFPEGWVIPDFVGFYYDNTKIMPFIITFFKSNGINFSADMHEPTGVSRANGSLDYMNINFTKEYVNRDIKIEYKGVKGSFKDSPNAYGGEWKSDNKKGLFLLEHYNPSYTLNALVLNLIETANQSIGLQKR